MRLSTLNTSEVGLTTQPSYFFEYYWESASGSGYVKFAAADEAAADGKAKEWADGRTIYRLGMWSTS